jgi:hypothetical protein
VLRLGLVTIQLMSSRWARALAAVEAALPPHRRLNTFQAQKNSQKHFVDFILVNPAWRSLLSFSRVNLHSESAANPYGHALCRYIPPGGTWTSEIQRENEEKRKTHGNERETGEALQYVRCGCPSSETLPEESAPLESTESLGVDDDAKPWRLFHGPESDHGLCFNIVGAPGSRRMANFLCAETYFFASGSSAYDLGAEQGGVHERSLVALRLGVSTEQLEKLHSYYRSVYERENAKDASYALVPGPFHTAFRRLFGTSEKRNCAGWTSQGLVEAGLLNKPSSFPKLIFIRLFLEHAVRRPWGVDVLFFKNRSRLPDGRKVATGGFVSPLSWWLSRKFWRLENLATVVISTTDSGEVKVKVKAPAWKSHLDSWQAWKQTRDQEQKR